LREIFLYIENAFNGAYSPLSAKYTHSANVY